MKLRFFVISLMMVFYTTSSYAQIFVGLRDNRIGVVGYTMKQKYSLFAEQSLYSQKPSTQHIRAALAYNYSIARLDYGGLVYIGGQWNGGYFDYGASVGGKLKIQEFGSIDLVANPHFDSGYQFLICVKAGVTVKITDEIGFIAHYSSIPEFRMVENRIRVGLRFINKRLQVSPVISFPLNEDPRTLRVLTSFMYRY